jgi:hypothetical protein
MAGLVPAIHAFTHLESKAWMPATGAGMTLRSQCLNANDADFRRRRCYQFPSGYCHALLSTVFS